MTWFIFSSFRVSFSLVSYFSIFEPNKSTVCLCYCISQWVLFYWFHFFVPFFRAFWVDCKWFFHANWFGGENAGLSFGFNLFAYQSMGSKGGKLKTTLIFHFVMTFFSYLRIFDSRVLAVINYCVSWVAPLTSTFETYNFTLFLMYWLTQIKTVTYTTVDSFLFAVKYDGLVNVLGFYVICIRKYFVRHSSCYLVFVEQIRYERARSCKHACVLIIVIITKLIVVYSYCRKSYPPMFLTMSTSRKNPFCVFFYPLTWRRESGEFFPKHTSHTHTPMSNVTFSLPFVIINFYVRHIRRYIWPSIRW